MKRALICLLFLCALGLTAGELQDSVGSILLYNTNLSQDSIAAIMAMPREPILDSSGYRFVDTTFFKIAADYRSGSIVTCRNGCLFVREKVFDLRKGAKK